MIFVDVGAHEGQTLEEVVKPSYGFETIYAFEPMLAQYNTLFARFERYYRRVWMFPCGLSDRNEQRLVYGANEGMEASVFPEKNDVDENVATLCSFISASEFFRGHIPAEGYRVFLKLNCEGSEVAILDDLIDSGEIWKVDNVLIDFDVRKVPGREGEEARILRKLAVIGFWRYCLAQDVMKGETHQDRIAAWLGGVL